MGDKWSWPVTLDWEQEVLACVCAASTSGVGSVAMVRFRLKTPFLTQAQSQIQGGVWYKVRFAPIHSIVPSNTGSIHSVMISLSAAVCLGLFSCAVFEVFYGSFSVVWRCVVLLDGCWVRYAVTFFA